MSIFEYSFFQYALIGSLLASIVCGMIGTYIVSRRLVFISGGITHASFGGIGIGVLLGINPVWAAMVFAVLCAFGVQWMSGRGNIREDSAIAMFWTFGMSVGIICCFLTPGFMPDMPSFLFGSILAVGATDLCVLAVLTVVVTAVFTLFYRPIMNVAFDANFARSQHMNVAFIEYMMMGLIAMTIVSTLRLVGIVLAISLLTVPQMTANVFTNSFKRIIIYSILIGWADCLLGLGLSYWFNVPSGAAIIFVSIIVYALAKLAKVVPHAFFIVIALAIFASCSTQKNTSGSRFWHAFNAKYNIYYNGAMAYVEGSLEKETGNRDNYTDLIPLYYVGNKGSVDLGKSNFDRAIEKSKKAVQRHSIKRRLVWTKNRKKTDKDLEWLSRKEYNPFLWKAWMLMGRSQFHKGAFDEAASTFSYMSRLYEHQPAIYGKARAWLAKAYVEEGWLYDAEDVIRNIRRDSIDWRAVKEWDYTYADYYIHTGEYAKAVPYLRKVIRHEMRRKQRAREWYLLGQLYTRLGNNAEAYHAFKRVIRQNPPYELEFNARISMTEVMAHGKSRQMIGRLRRMARSDKNKDYLDQVFYAIGNIHMADRDTAKAIAAYEQGNKCSTRSGTEKGVLLLRLGDLYWEKEKYGDARRCYGEAIGLLDKEWKDYEQLSNRSVVLDELVPYTDAVHLQDSLQALAKMSEADRNVAIDRVITALKEKEREERYAREAAEAEQKQSESSAKYGNQASSQTIAHTAPGAGGQSGAWYFYNPIAVSQGKQAFRRQWGKRENVDNWQRANRSVVGGFDVGTELTDEQCDSIATVEARIDSLSNVRDSAQNDPHRREYYLAQIPFTEEQVAASNKIIEDGLFNAGVIFKDQLDNLRQSERYLDRLTTQYPDYAKTDEAYYHLFLLYSRENKHQEANAYVEKLKEKYPQSQWTTLLTDPYFVENAKFGVHIEDSLYAATYEAFKDNRFSEVEGNAYVSETRFPQGANRDKFLFIGGLSKLNSGDEAGCMKCMEDVVKQFPDSRISEMAGMIVNGVRAGKRLHGGGFDLGSIWERRSEVMNDSDSIAARKFVTDRIAPFNVMLVYLPESVSENRLLFEMARFNFTSFIVRNFNIAIEDDGNLHRMRVSGFRNYDEARQYARMMHESQTVVRQMGDARTFIISDKNLELLGTQFSYKDYQDFYARHFAPIKVSNKPLLTEPTEINVKEQTDDGGKNLPSDDEEKSIGADGFIIDLQSKDTATEGGDDGIVIDDSQENVPEKPKQKKSDTLSTAKGDINQPKTTPLLPVKGRVSKAKADTGDLPVDDSAIIIDDPDSPKSQVKADKAKQHNKKEEKPKDTNIEDEYYDLEGF